MCVLGDVGKAGEVDGVLGKRTVPRLRPGQGEPPESQGPWPKEEELIIQPEKLSRKGGERRGQGGGLR